jgi:RpiB/LacA/LacB family sugar-phosphate isomerase
MRVYLGSDHAGFELKQQIIDHLKKTGHEPIDCGAFSYDPEDDYPAFCIDAATRTVADPDSLGIVLGGSGNGEQIAANKVPLRAGMERRDGVVGAAAQQRAADRNRRPHAHRRGGVVLRRCLPDHTVVES